MHDNKALTVNLQSIGFLRIRPADHRRPDQIARGRELGNEDIGLSVDVRAACDDIVFIPQAHGDSLNVGHAAAIAMFELGRSSRTPEHDGLAECT